MVLRASQVVLVVKNPPANAGDMRDLVWSLDQTDSLEEGTAIHSSIPGESHRQESLAIESQRGGHNWSDLKCTHTCMECNLQRVWITVVCTCNLYNSVHQLYLNFNSHPQNNFRIKMYRYTFLNNCDENS